MPAVLDAIATLDIASPTSLIDVSARHAERGPPSYALPRAFSTTRDFTRPRRRFCASTPAKDAAA